MESNSINARMIERRIAAELNELLDSYPAVALLGPRQVGKTTLAHSIAEQRPSIYLDLESDADRAKLSEPELYLAGYEDKLVILDEVQRMPGLFQNLRGLINRGRRKGRRTGRFLLLGSVTGSPEAVGRKLSRADRLSRNAPDRWVGGSGLRPEQIVGTWWLSGQLSGHQ